MSVRVPVAYAVGLSGCASVGYAINNLLSSASVCEADISACDLSVGGFIPFLVGGILVAVVSMILGARLVVPLLFLAVGAGALAVGDAGFSRTFGGGFVVAGLIALAGAFVLRGMAAKSTEKLQNLLAEGSPAIGTVLSVRDTGVRINDNPRVELRVRIEPENGPAFEASKTITMRLIRPVLTGERYPVLYLPGNPAEFGLITDIENPAAVPPRLLPVVERLAGERYGAPAPRQSLSDEIAKLDALHRSGALSVAEFHEAKARLLAKD
ncbi:hypothetical protein GCM10027589_44580 [Actinocorallia lasiicapitis]